MAKEVTINDMQFTIIDALTGRLWQEIQKLTEAMQEGKLSKVSYANANLKLLVTKLCYQDENNETVTITNVEDILNRILDAEVEVLDKVSEEVASIISNNPYVKKKAELAKATNVSTDTTRPT